MHMCVLVFLGGGVVNVVCVFAFMYVCVYVDCHGSKAYSELKQGPGLAGCQGWGAGLGARLLSDAALLPLMALLIGS